MAIDTEERTDDKQVAGEASTPAKSNKRVLVIVAAVLVGLITLGIISSIAAGHFFKKGAERLVENATQGSVKVDINKDGGETTIKGDDGEQMKINTSAKDLPKDFPKQVPLYKGASLKNVSTYSYGDVKSYAVTYETKDDLEKVFEYYKSAMTTDEWQVSATNITNDESASVTGKNEAAELFVSVYMYHEDNATIIALSVNEGSDEE